MPVGCGRAQRAAADRVQPCAFFFVISARTLPGRSGGAAAAASALAFPRAGRLRLVVGFSLPCGAGPRAGPSRAAGAPLRRGGARNLLCAPVPPCRLPPKTPGGARPLRAEGACCGEHVPLFPRRGVKTRRSRCVGAFGQLVAEGRAAACLPPFSALREPLRVVCASFLQPARGKLVAARRGDLLR